MTNLIAAIATSIQTHWKSVLGGLGLIGAIGLTDGLIYYSVFQVPVLDYAEWSDYTRMGMAGGVVALALTVLLLVFLCLVVAFLTAGLWVGLHGVIGILVAASELTAVIARGVGNPGALSSNFVRAFIGLPATLSKALERAFRIVATQAMARYKAIGYISFSLAMLLYLSIHYWHAANVNTVVEGGQLASIPEVGRAADICSTDELGNQRSLHCFLGRWLSPNIRNTITVTMADGKTASTKPLVFLGKLASHYIVLPIYNAAPMVLFGGRIQSIGRYVETELPTAITEKRIASIEAAIEEMKGWRTSSNASSVLSFSFPALADAAYDPNENRLGFSIPFESDNQRGLSSHSQKFLRQVAETLTECQKLKGSEQPVTLNVRGIVSSAGIPDVRRHDRESINRQIELARDRESEVKRFLQAYTSIRVVGAQDIQPADSERAVVGDFEDRLQGVYSRRLGLLNRRAWITLTLDEIGDCPLRSD